MTESHEAQGDDSRKILCHLDGFTYRRLAPLVLGMLVGRDGKMLDPARTTRGKRDDRA